MHPSHRQVQDGHKGVVTFINFFSMKNKIFFILDLELLNDSFFFKDLFE